MNGGVIVCICNRLQEFGFRDRFREFDMFTEYFCLYSDILVGPLLYCFFMAGVERVDIGRHLFCGLQLHPYIGSYPESALKLVHR
jgi:hypothetical protein